MDLSNKGVLVINFADLTPSEKLDFILKHISEFKQPYWRTFDELFLSLEGILSDPKRDEINRVLSKLVKDGFVIEWEYDSGLPERRIGNFKKLRYYVSFEGEAILQLEGGYTGRLRNKEAIERKASDNERTTISLSKRMTALTVVLALAALPTGFYAILQIIEWCMKYHANCCSCSH